tara:strand:+ start:2216 stop:3091 length:876 start_codon:yes stop_codon:yes gene_type:complete
LINIALPTQKLQDWLTQQWVILKGKPVDIATENWLLAPFGNLGVIGENFIEQLAENENLKVQRKTSSGLLKTINDLSLLEKELERLATEVIDFYEHTAQYQLGFSIRWNPLFKGFGSLVNLLYSNRIQQLYLPTRNLKKDEKISSELIQLVDKQSKRVVYTIWLRTFIDTKKVIYSGIYSTCRLPSGKVCIKAVFPLPQGNATVIMKPSVDDKGALTLDSSGKKFGDAGFYFVLKDKNEKTWATYIQSFQDRLTIHFRHNKLYAEQRLHLWRQQVLQMNYSIKLTNSRSTD